MRLVDNLRKAEQKGAMTIRRGVERAREEWADVERRLRQRMRIYPQKRSAATVPGGMNAGLGMTASNQRPIISIHGRDVDSEK